MKKITLLSFIALLFNLSQAQVVVTVNEPDISNGYVNAFNESDGSYAFGFGYPVISMKTTFPSSSQITLAPNFAIWDENDDTPTDGGPAWDPAWFDAANDPAKIVEGISYVENSSLVGQDVTFIGTIDATTLDAGYTARAFIKILNGSYGLLLDKTVNLTAAGDFTLNATAAETGTGAIIQYGFDVKGLIAAPSAEASLGTVNISARTLGIKDYQLIDFSTYPNPTKNSWNVKSKSENISTIRVYDILGKNVLSISPNNREATIDGASLKSGLYFAKVESASGVSSLKLVKE